MLKLNTTPELLIWHIYNNEYLHEEQVYIFSTHDICGFYSNPRKPPILTLNNMNRFVLLYLMGMKYVLLEVRAEFSYVLLKNVLLHMFLHVKILYLNFFLTILAMAQFCYREGQ